MSAPSLIFWSIFVVPMVTFLMWVLWQDKRHRKTGLFVLIVMVVVVIIYNYIKTRPQ